MIFRKNLLLIISIIAHTLVAVALCWISKSIFMQIIDVLCIGVLAWIQCLCIVQVSKMVTKETPKTDNDQNEDIIQ